jgi:hypothetical protein
MVIRPEELMETYDIRGFEEKIDNTLIEKWGKGELLAVRFDYNVPLAILERVANSYRKVKWDVVCQSHQSMGPHDPLDYKEMIFSLRENKPAT